MAGDPVEEAMGEVMGEVFWSDSLEEAEEKLARFIEGMDPDLRELLLERRRALCSDARRVASTLVALMEAEADARARGDMASRLNFAELLAASSYLMQCTPTWQRLGPREKARVLAPLYRASYALRLARRSPPRQAAALLKEAERMLSIALERAMRMGILAELRRFIEEVGEALEEGG